MLLCMRKSWSVLGFLKNPNYTISYVIMNQVQFFFSRTEWCEVFYLVMLPSDALIRKNKLEINIITVILKWAFVVCRNYDSFRHLAGYYLHWQHFLPRGKLFSARTLFLRYGSFSFEAPKNDLRLCFMSSWVVH